MVVSRFWEQLNCIPWPHRLATFVSSLVHGNDKRGRLLRRTIMRYLSLSFVLTMRSFCTPVKKRFPELQMIRDAGKLFIYFLLLLCVGVCFFKSQIWDLVSSGSMENMSFIQISSTTHTHKMQKLNEDRRCGQIWILASCRDVIYGRIRSRSGGLLIPCYGISADYLYGICRSETLTCASWRLDLR